MSFDTSIRWLTDHYVEIAGTALGLAYIILSIRQRILAWPVGLASSAIYVFVFFVSGFYAGMALQVYYVAVAIYGWYYWFRGSRVLVADDEKKTHAALPVSRMPAVFWLPLGIAAMLLFISSVYILKNYTDSPIPVWDSLATSLSIAATWMLARKYLENWIIWIVADTLSVIIFAVKGLWPTVMLFVVYTVMAVLGYRRWKKALVIPASA